MSETPQQRDALDYAAHAEPKRDVTETLARQPGGFRWRIALGIAAYAALIFIPFLGYSRTLTSHEVMITHPSLRMLEGEGWIVPQFSSFDWLDKPPLINWITAACFYLLGFSEFSARLPAALSAIGLAVLIYLLAARYFSQRAAVFAGLAQATCVYAYMQGRLGEIDMPFTFLLACAHGVLLWRWGRGPLDLPLKPALLFYLFAGLAVLAKGVLAVVIIAMTVFVVAIFRRSWKPVLSVIATPAVLLFLLLVVPWHVAAYTHSGEQAVEQWHYNAIMRFFGTTHLGVVWNPFFYVIEGLWLMLPWTVVLIIGARQLWRDARRDAAPLDRFLWAWFLGGFVFLSISMFKHKHYVLPVLPVLSIFTGYLLDLHLRRSGIHARRSVIGLFVAMPIIFGIVGAVVLPMRDHRQPTVQWLQQEVGQVPGDEPLYVVGLGQSAAYPYIPHPDQRYIDKEAAFKSTLAEHGEQGMWVLTLHERLEMAETLNIDVRIVAQEQPHEDLPKPETLILARAYPAPPPTTQPN